MVSIIATWICYHILLPATVLASVIFRYTIFSSIYLVLLLAYPYVPSLTHSSKGQCMRYVLGVLVTSLAFIVAQTCFQIALVANPPYGSLVGDRCTQKEKVLQYIGLVRLDGVSAGDVVRYVLPDVLTFVMSLLTFVLIKKITPPADWHQQQQTVQRNGGTVSHDAMSGSTSEDSLGMVLFQLTLIELKNGAILLVAMVAMALAGIANPSLFSGLYLTTFIVLMTIWSLHGTLLSTKVIWLRGFVLFVAAANLILLFYYQIEFFRTAFPPSEIGSRLMGLTPFVNVSCESYATQLVLTRGITWTEFISPPLTLLMYWSLAWGVKVFFASDKLQSKMHLQRNTSRKRKQKKEEKLPLVGEDVQPHSYDAIGQPSTSAEIQTQTTADVPPATKHGLLLSWSNWISKLKTQSFYVLALVVMMAWSVTLHSWLTLVLLVWSCVLWLVKNRSWAVLHCSPFILFYALALIYLQFVYSLPLTESELPTVIVYSDNSTFNLSSFGIKHYYNNFPGVYLGSQILYTVVFWIVLHQYIYIRKHRNEIAETSPESTSWIVKSSRYIRDKLGKYWILVVYGFLFIMATEGYPSGIKMVYAVALTLSGFVFELSWNMWRKLLSLFLYFLIIYTMIVLLLVYTYQLDEFPKYWKHFTNFTNDQLTDLGLVQYQTAGELFVRILIPTLFLLTVIFQKHYFNDNFLKQTSQRVDLTIGRVNGSHSPSSNDSGEESIEMQDITVKEAETKTNPKKSQFRQFVETVLEIFLKYWCGLIGLIWQLLEFHIWKLLAITVLVSALYQATAVYFFIFSAWIVFVSLRMGTTILHLFTSAYVALIITGSMFYQLDFIHNLRGRNLFFNCSFVLSENRTWTGNYDMIAWIGFSKMPNNGSFFWHEQGCMSIIIMLAFESIIVRRQDWRRVYRNEEKLHPLLTALYPSITHFNADDNFLSCCKYFINYWFYKFGVEACYIMAVITIWLRADAFGVVYSVLFVTAMILRRRSSLARFWTVYAFILMVVLIGEYAFALGMPPTWCDDGIHEYPWTRFQQTTVQIRNRLVRWLYLPDFIVPPYSRSLIVDVFQLIFIICQLNVFDFEKTKEAHDHGGDNMYLKPTYLDGVAASDNPKKNFMTKETRSLLDQIKVAVFKYSFWLTVAFIFVAGTSTISLFCLGYLIAFFYLMARHQSLSMGKLSRLLRIWNIVLGYNVAVIIIKVSSQITSCVYIEILAKRACVFVQLMNLVCAKPADYEGLSSSSNICATPNSNANTGLTWDFVCFLFLIIQRRIFQSYYFLHALKDMRISMKLASRGAELFREKLIMSANHRKNAEDENISLIKKNMEAIRKKSLNIERAEMSSNNHSEAMQSGDYYMFEDDSNEEEKAKGKDIKNPLQMLHTAETVGIDKALEERREDKNLLDENDKLSPVPKETIAGKSTEDIADNAQQETEKKIGTAKKAMIFLKELCMSGLDSLILWLNTVNCDYRNVVLQLSGEKGDLMQAEFNEPPPNNGLATKIVIESSDKGETSHPENGRKQSSDSSSNQGSQISQLKPMDFDKDQMRIVRLFYALWYAIIAHTDIVCYFLVILNLMLSGSVVSLVLPLAIFLWATLSTPRPTSRFWDFCILYLEVIIVIKFIFQFEFYPWNTISAENTHIYHPFWWPRIIGIEQKDQWSSLDLTQLLAFFFHKQMLKTRGIWDKANILDREMDADSSSLKDSENVAAEDSQPLKSKKVAITKNQPTHSTPGGEGKEKEQEEQSRIKRILMSPYRFFRVLLNHPYYAVTDVYIFIFLCDFINFIIIIFGYWAFGKYSTKASDVVTNIALNRVPSGFLVMLLCQFSMMFIDRALYLRKNILGKLIFQVILVIAIHVWMFFILPTINERPFYMNHVAQTWYFFKAVYFLLSAYQIRCGYPKRVLGNFLTKAYGTINLFLFTGYRAIPFLAELTAIMDWMFVATTMGIGEWFKFHAIYAEVFEIKCWRVFETNYPSPRATAKSEALKYFVGGLLVFFLIAIIWFPLLFMNLALTVGGVVNNPTEVSIQITANSFEPLFQVNVDSESITVWDQNKFNTFVRRYANDSTAALFLSSFTASQVVSVRIDGESKTVWAISPPQRQKLLNKLNASNANPVQFDFGWNLVRPSDTNAVVRSTGNHKLQLTNSNSSRLELFNLLKTPGVVGTPAKIRGLFPKYIYAGWTGASTAATRLHSANGALLYVDTNMTIRYDLLNDFTSWWRVYESNQSASAVTNPSLEIIVFSDKVSSSSWSFLVGFGIIGLYVSIVLVVGRFVRSTLIGSTSTIMFQELPYVDRVLKICLDIYLVREEREFLLEEELYAKLLFLYRSPETMIRMTRPKQE